MEASYKRQLKKAVEEYCKKHGEPEKPLSQAEVARRAGISTPRLSQILNDAKRTPRPAELQRLATVLEFDVEKIEKLEKEVAGFRLRPRTGLRRTKPVASMALQSLDVAKLESDPAAAAELRKAMSAFAAALSPHNVAEDVACRALTAARSLLVQNDAPNVREEALQVLGGLRAADIADRQLRREAGIRFRDEGLPGRPSGQTSREPFPDGPIYSQLPEVAKRTTDDALRNRVTSLLQSIVRSRWVSELTHRQRRWERDFVEDSTREDSKRYLFADLAKHPRWRQLWELDPDEVYAGLLDRSLWCRMGMILPSEQEVLEASRRIGFDEAQSGSAMKWWEAFLREQKKQRGIANRLAREIDRRRLRLTDYFMAYVMSGSDSVQGNLEFADALAIRSRLSDVSNEPNGLGGDQRKANLETRFQHSARIFGRTLKISHEKESCQEVIIAVSRLKEIPEQYRRFKSACDSLPDCSELLAEFALWLALNCTALDNRDSALDEASGLVARAKAINSQCPTALYAGGLISQAQGELDKAVTALESAIAIDPFVSSFYFQLAVVYRNLREIGEANRILRRAIRTVPEEGLLWSNAAVNLVHAGEFDQACHLSRIAVNAFTDQYAVQYNYACALSRQNVQESTARIPSGAWKPIKRRLKRAMTLVLDKDLQDTLPETGRRTPAATVADIARDFDFARLRNEPEFKELLVWLQDQEPRAETPVPEEAVAATSDSK